MKKKTAIIIGGGPAGLTCAYELLKKSDVHPIVLEASDGLGGISRTFNHNGNRIDLGGHRFFSKSDRVMDWWQEILPVDRSQEMSEPISIQYQNKSREFTPKKSELHDAENVMLVRPRVSRILYRGKFFDYPISLSLDTLKKLGFIETIIIGLSYVKARLLPIKPENTLEDFVINRFGKRLYATFFRDYTEKVWGVPCNEIPADWGAQRIKGVSILSVLKHAFKKLFSEGSGDIGQKGTETSLIEQFLYPKYGPGQMWDRVGDLVKQKGGEILFENEVVGLERDGQKITGVVVRDKNLGEENTLSGDYIFSTMPVRTLFEGLTPKADNEADRVAKGLMYRDFMTVGLLCNKVKLGGQVTGGQLRQKLPDNWIYIQEPGVMVGRLQIFNNWSPFMVQDPEKVWIGLEYFLNDTDKLWNMNDEQIIEFAKQEMEKINILEKGVVEDAVVIRTPKAYPAYFGTYDEFDKVKDYTTQFENLYLLGRNGMHRYNNQDHSMLTAMTAVDNIVAGIHEKESVWQVNTEQEYHEQKEAS